MIHSNSVPNMKISKYHDFPPASEFVLARCSKMQDEEHHSVYVTDAVVMKYPRRTVSLNSVPLLKTPTASEFELATLSK